MAAHGKKICRWRVKGFWYDDIMVEVIEAPASCEWYGDNEFLILRQGTKETAHATWLIGHDQDSAGYAVLYYDDRHFSRVYEMSFENNIWKIWRNAPGFVQSFEAKISEDKTLK